MLLTNLSTLFSFYNIRSLGVYNSQTCVSNLTVCDNITREIDYGFRIKTCKVEWDQFQA
ncbi:hypothetical protein AAZX31_16G055800 [Glycine max]